MLTFFEILDISLTFNEQNILKISASWERVALNFGSKNKENNRVYILGFSQNIHHRLYLCEIMCIN